jgi:hypothetical protein
MTRLDCLAEAAVIFNHQNERVYDKQGFEKRNLLSWSFFLTIKEKVKRRKVLDVVWSFSFVASLTIEMRVKKTRVERILLFLLELLS